MALRGTVRSSHHRSRKAKPRKSERVRLWYEANRDTAEKMSHSAIASILGVTPNTVKKFRVENEGYKPKEIHRATSENQYTVRVRNAAEIASNNSLNTESKRLLLTRLAKDIDVRPDARISAVRELHKIDTSMGTARELGPGDPLNDEARVHRLGLLITACGPDIHERALAQARKEWDAQAKDSSTQDPTPTS